MVWHDTDVKKISIAYIEILEQYIFLSAMRATYEAFTISFVLNSNYKFNFKFYWNYRIAQIIVASDKTLSNNITKMLQIAKLSQPCQNYSMQVLS